MKPTPKPIRCTHTAGILSAIILVAFVLGMALAVLL